MRKVRAAVCTVGLIVIIRGSSMVSADVCQAPSESYPTIQSAIDAPICVEIELAAQTFGESLVIARDLVLRGVSSAATVIEGRLTVQGPSILATIEDLTVDGSAAGVGGTLTEALKVEGGAEVSGLGLVIINAAMDLHPIFTDGFESGDTAAWSSATP